MKIFVIVVLCGLATSANLYSQDSPYWTSLVSSAFRDVTAADDSTLVETDYDEMRVSNNRGESWQRIPFRFPGRIRGLRCASSSVWSIVVGESAAPILFWTSDRGHSWRSVSPLSKNAGTTAEGVIVSADKNRIAHYSSGQGWTTLQEISEDNECVSIHMSGDLCYAVMLDGIWRLNPAEPNDNTHWTFPNQYSSVDVSRLNIASNGSVQIVFDSAIDALWLLPPGEQEWRLIPTPENVSAAFAVNDSVMIYSERFSSDSTHGFPFSHWRIGAPSAQKAETDVKKFYKWYGHFLSQMTNIVFLDSLHGYAIGLYNAAYTTRDGGKSWFLKSYFPFQTFASQEFVSTLKSRNGGKTALCGSLSIFAARTQDGLQWRSMAIGDSILFTNTWRDVDILAGDTIAAVDHNGKVFLAKDGADYVRVDMSVGQGEPALHSDERNFLAAAGSLTQNALISTLVKWSYDKGRTTASSVNIPGFSMSSMQGVADSLLYLSGQWLDQSDSPPENRVDTSGCVEVRPANNSWRRIPYDPDTSTVSVIQHIYQDGTILLSEYSSFLVGRLRRIDPANGKTLYFSSFDNRPRLTGSAFHQHYVSFRNDAEGVAGGGRNLMFTADSGRTWRSDTSKARLEGIKYASLLCWNEDGLYSVDMFQDGMFRHNPNPSPLTTGVEEPPASSLVSPVWIFSASPNPSAGNVQFDCWFSAQRSWANATLHLTSVQGQEHNLSNQLPSSYPGAHAQFSITLPEDLPNGIYYASLSSGGWRHVIPVVVLRSR